MYTTLVQNHQQQSSGNRNLRNTNILLALAVALGVSSCTPKATVLRSPDYQGNVVGGSKGTTDAATAAKQAEILAAEKAAEKKKLASRTISLLLPFQLQQLNQDQIQDSDVKRSALALDFYQGFQYGLEHLATKGESFRLNTLDSRDNAFHVGTLATSEDVQESAVIVGPVYPQEIKSFGAKFVNKDVLQINPLAASPASDFSIPNLVSITPSIKSHTNAIATRVAREWYTGDVIIIYNTSDADSRQYLTGMMAAIKQQKAKVNIISVSTLAQLNEQLSLTGTNFVVSGTTDKTQLNALVSNLIKKYGENYYSIRLFGHPLWDRFDFSLYPTFSSLSPIISTESSLKNWTSAVKNFKDTYYNKYGVYPSDQSYKGYDVAVFFGGLLNKYGADNFKDKLTTETYQGIFNTYKFNYNESWGYTNESVSFKEFRSGSFQLQ